MIKINLQPKTSNHWETPRSFFNKLNEEFNFKWDICAEAFNAKLPLHYTPENSCLDNDWEVGPWLFINPPYKPLKPFIEKCHEQAARGCKIVALVPISTVANMYFKNDYVSEVRIIKGRLNFEAYGEAAQNGNSTARHNSVLIIYNKDAAGQTMFNYH
jgi:phage N-6-adenine-methyltransferase